MDNISHSLIGLALGELAERTLAPEPDPVRARVRHRLLLVSCWAASTVPDLDLLLAPLAPRPLGYLLHHRGHTHTLLGTIPQALLLLALLWLLWPSARHVLRASRSARLATIGVVWAGLLLHIGIDYLNVYGVHPFYPFDPRWVYGDMVYIVEPVFWVAFGAPLAAIARPGMARRIGILALVAVPLAAAALGFMAWGSLAGLAALGLGLAWYQCRAPARSRAALGLAVLAAGMFVTFQGLAVRAAQAIVAAAPHHGRLLDVALSAFPANPLCWSFVAIELDSGSYRLRRGLLSLAPGALPPQACPPRLAGPSAGSAAAPVVWQWEQATPLAVLRGLRERDCRMDAWLRFARAPSLDEGSATDVRFGLPGTVNFSTINYSGDAGKPCPHRVPGWGYPRADLLEQASGS